MDERDERLFKLEIRLAAIEYLLANVYAASFGQRPDPAHDVKTANDFLRNMLRAQTVPGVEPVWSDHVTAELQEAMERVLSIMEDMVASSAKKETKETKPAPPRQRSSRWWAFSER
jgi:uncharacterized coiled-coil protein SlyX